MKSTSSLFLPAALCLLACVAPETSVWAGDPAPEASAPDTLIGWTVRLLDATRQREARFHSIRVSMEQVESADSRKALVEIETPEKLHRFGHLYSMAAGPFDSNRTADRVWHIRFQVAVTAPTFGEEQLANLPGVHEAAGKLSSELQATPALELGQMQLKQAQPVQMLSGVARTPLSLTLYGKSARDILDRFAALAAAMPYLALQSVKIAPVGARAIGTLGADLLTRPLRPAAATPDRAALEEGAAAILRAACDVPAPLKMNTVSGNLRLQFDGTARGLAQGWEALGKLLGLSGLSQFEIVELRVDASGRPRISGLLYF